MSTKIRHCKYVITKGKRAGLTCGKVCHTQSLDYCGTHKSTEIAVAARIALEVANTGINNVTNTRLQEKTKGVQATLEMEVTSYAKALKTDRQMYECRSVAVYLYVGKPGSGKTYSAYDWCLFQKKALYKLSPVTAGTGLNFDGYVDQPVLLIDEMGGWMDCEFFKQLTDKYPMYLPTSNNQRVEAKYNYVLITTNVPIDKWFVKRSTTGTIHEQSENEYEAIKRRIDVCMECKKIDDKYYADRIQL